MSNEAVLKKLTQELKVFLGNWNSAGGSRA